MQFDNFCKFTYYLSFHSVDSSLCHSTAFLPPLFSISQLLIILLSHICCFQDLLWVRIWGILTMILPNVVLYVYPLRGFFSSLDMHAAWYMTQKTLRIFIREYYISQWYISWELGVRKRDFYFLLYLWYTIGIYLPFSLF